jgi:hypothetical protein
MESSFTPAFWDTLLVVGNLLQILCMEICISWLVERMYMVQDWEEIKCRQFLRMYQPTTILITR